jgi:hypothetical protein
MTSRPSPAAPILAVLAVVMVLLGAYVAGYLLLAQTSEAEDLDGEESIARIYSQTWMPTFFYPGGWLEAKLTKRHVALNWETSDEFHHSFSFSP